MFGLLLIAAVAIGFFFGNAAKPVAGSDARDQIKSARPGPWGDVRFVPITIDCPDELLPVRAFESEVTKWKLPGYTTERFLGLLSQFNITGELREEFRAEDVLHIVADGLEIVPSKRILVDLPASARHSLYSLLASFPENLSALTFVLRRNLDQRFTDGRVSEQTADLLKSVSCEYGRYLVFSDIGHLLSLIPDYDERVRFVKALTAQQTMLVRLHVPEGADADRLTSYWGKGERTGKVRSLFESLARVPGGASIGLASLLPSWPGSRLYSFQAPEEPNKPSVRKDCHWTAFNFFANPPEDCFGTPAGVVRALEDDYTEVAGDARFGDLVLFMRPGGVLIHSSVYIADDIVYTKNGDTALHPWMFSTISNLLDEYSFQVTPEQSLTVKYYRSKRL